MPSLKKAQTEIDNVSTLSKLENGGWEDTEFSLALRRLRSKALFLLPKLSTATNFLVFTANSTT